MRTIFKRGLRTFPLVFLLFCGWNCSATLAQVPKKTLSPDEFKDDLRILRLTLEKAHAGLYRYTPKEQMDAAFDRVEARLNQPMTELEFFRTLAPLIDLIHDAHTSLKPSAATLKYIGKTAKVFPLDIRYVEGRAFIEKNLGPNKKIPLASELLSINGIPMTEITGKVLTIKSADGLNRIPKYEVANVNFWINYFEMVDDSEVFKIEARDPRTGKTEQYSTQGISASCELAFSQDTSINELRRMFDYDQKLPLDVKEVQIKGACDLYAAPNKSLDRSARERYFNEAAMLKYARAASEPKIVEWYDTGHDLNDLQALIDRAKSSVTLFCCLSHK